MVLTDKLIIIKSLLDWAREKDYPVLAPIKKDDSMYLKRLEHSFEESFDPRDPLEKEAFEKEKRKNLETVADAIIKGKYVEPSQLRNAVIQGSQILELLSTPTLSQFVYTPTGYVEYCLNVGEDEMSESSAKEEDILKSINKGDFTETLYLNHGLPLKNWKSDRVTVGERDNNSDLLVTINFYPSGNKITRASVSPVYHGVDKNCFEIARPGNSRLNNLSYAIGRLCGSGATISCLNGKKISGSPPKIFEVKTNLDLVFKKFDTIIRYSP